MLDSFLCDQFLYSHNKATNFVFDTVKRRFMLINLLVLKGSKEWVVHSISITVLARST